MQSIKHSRVSAVLLFSLMAVGQSQTAENHGRYREMPYAIARARNDGAAMTASVRQMWPAGVIPSQARPGAWAYEVGTLLDGMAARVAGRRCTAR